MELAPHTAIVRAKILSLREILVAVVAVAIAFAIWRLPLGDGIDIPVWTLAFYFVVSLLRHAAATVRRLLASPALSRVERSGGWLLLTVLVGLATALIAACAVRWLAADELVLKQSPQFPFDYVQFHLLPRDLAVLTMLTAIGLGWRQYSLPQLPRKRQYFYLIIAAVVMTGGIVRLTGEKLLVLFLVYVAVSGIEMAQPARLLSPDMNVSNVVRVHEFTWAAYAGLPLFVSSLLAVGSLVLWWDRPRWRVVLLVSLAGSLAAECALAGWIAFRGVWRLSVSMTQGIIIPSPVVALVAVIILVAAVFILWPALVRPSRKDPSNGSSHRAAFFYESWMASLLLGVIATAAAIAKIVSDIRIATQTVPGWLRGRPLTWEDIADLVSQHPAVVISLAAGIGGFGIAWVRWRNRAVPIPDALPHVNPSQFTVTMLGLILTLAAAGPILAAASFGFWFIRFGRAF